MKCLLVLVAMLTFFVAAGCSDPQVIAEASIDNEGTGERLALGDLPIRLLPYDRDAIFDSLQAAHSEPQPAIPPEILAQQQQVQEAQSAWRMAEERWTAVRDSLSSLSQQLSQMQSQGLRGTPQYTAAFTRFGTLENAERQVNQEMQQALARFDQLRQQTMLAADSVRVQRDLWAEQAFADFESVVASKLEESGFEEQVDTTDAQGLARFRASEGTWWVYGRYTLPQEELYWNIPLEVVGDSVHIGLTRENADVRPVL